MFILTNILLLILFIFYLLKDNLTAHFWIIDDHEIIINFLKGYNFNPFSFFFEQINFDLSFSRFRPTYWFNRSIEFFFFRDNPHLYYYLHFLMILGSFIFIFLSFRNLFLKNNLISIILTILISIQSFFIDIYTRLGPSERYSLFYLSIWFYLLSNFLNTEILNFKKIILFSLSTIFLSFSKENFLIFIPLSFLIILYLYLIKKINKKSLIISIFLVIFFLLISTPFLYEIKNKGFDVYARATSFIFRYQILKNNLIEILNTLSIKEILFFSLIIFIDKITKKKFLEFSISTISVVLIAFFNYFINLGQFLAPRYYFPILILKYFSFALIYYFAFISIKNKNKIKYFNYFIFIIFTIYIFFDYKNITLIKNSVYNNKLRTNNFKNYIDNLVKRYQKNTEYDFIFVYEPMFFEQLISINRFLDYRGVNKIRYVFLKNSCETYLEKSLEKKLCNYITEEFKGIKQNKKEKFILKNYNTNFKKDKNNKCILISNIEINEINCKFKFNYY